MHKYIFVLLFNFIEPKKGCRDTLNIWRYEIQDFLKYSKETLGYLALSSLLCVIVYYLGFTDIIASDVPIKAFIPIVFANIVIGYAIWTLAFLVGRIYKNPGW